jgi:hypothetical protein
MEGWSAGVMEGWSAGVMEGWSAGVMEGWSAGDPGQQSFAGPPARQMRPDVTEGWYPARIGCWSRSE